MRATRAQPCDGNSEWYRLRYIPRRWAIARTAKLFKNGRSQAVRLPREFRFPGKEVYIEKRDGEVVLRAKKKFDWEKFFSEPSPFPSNFMVRRKQPKLQKRRIF